MIKKIKKVYKFQKWRIIIKIMKDKLDQEVKHKINKVNQYIKALLKDNL